MHKFFALQMLGWYFPESTGGTEVYVAALAEELSKLDIQCNVSAPVNAALATDYLHKGTHVHRYQLTEDKASHQITGAFPHTGFDGFVHWLAQQRAAVYHQHSWTYGCGLHHLQAAKQLGMVTVLTVHVPGPVCLRGTMLQDGAKPCDGRIALQKCAQCWLQQRGMPAMARALVSKVPPSFGKQVRGFGRLGTALAATSLAQHHLATLLQAADAADHVVAVCQWLFDALLINGVPRSKLSLNRQGVASTPAVRPARAVHKPGAPLIVGFLGRWDPLKGVGVLVNAVLQLPAHVPLQLYIHAVTPQDPDMLRYMQQVIASAATSPRIKILPALASDEVAGFLQGIDLLAVPSQWFETGPLVVLEAFAVGTPVIGANLGGIAELVQHGQNGWLVDYDNTAAWAAALRQLATDRNLLQQLQQGIRPVRTMHDVALETKQLYLKLLANTAS